MKENVRWISWRSPQLECNTGILAKRCSKRCKKYIIIHFPAIYIQLWISRWQKSTRFWVSENSSPKSQLVSCETTTFLLYSLKLQMGGKKHLIENRLCYKGPMFDIIYKRDGQTRYRGFFKDSIKDKAPRAKAVHAYLLCPWHRQIVTHGGIFMVWSTS